MSATKLSPAPGMDGSLEPMSGGLPRTLPMPVIVLTLALAGLGIAGAMATRDYFLAVAALPLLVCAILRPQALLIFAIALTPFTMSLAGGSELAGTSSPTEYGFSDILLAIALPGLLVQACAHPRALNLRKMAVPLFLYLAAGIYSFILNMPAMHGATVSYFVGVLRTIQIIVVLPMAFAVVSWQTNELRDVLRGYLFGCAALAACGITAFFMGAREGLYLMGMHKNGVGLALSLGALIAIAALTQPREVSGQAERETPAAPLGMSQQFLTAVTLLCIAGLACSLSRGSYLSFITGLLYLSITRKRGRIFAGILAGAIVLLVGLMMLLPDESAEYVTDFSAQRYSNRTRIEQAQQSLEDFKQNPLLGDGFRARRDFLPHNIEATLLAENGLIGTLLFAWLLVAQFAVLRAGRRLFTGDPLREWICVALIACAIGLLTQSQFDPYWRRGPLWVPWAGSGLVVAMLYQERKSARRRRRRELEERTAKFRQIAREERRTLAAREPG